MSGLMSGLMPGFMPSWISGLMSGLMPGWMSGFMPGWNITVLFVMYRLDTRIEKSLVFRETSHVSISRWSFEKSLMFLNAGFLSTNDIFTWIIAYSNWNHFFHTLSFHSFCFPL
jgi:hypothetical protein